MDITAHTFFNHLPKVLDDLSSCCFVSIDLEFSGIGKGPGISGKGKSTLQERYDEVKNSADQYQILQVGLTICHEDPETATYTLKPYNLFLSPIIDRKLEIERIWSFQSGAVEFLLENNFSMENLFKDGVPYVSRDEEQRAMAKVIERFDRTTVRSSLDVTDSEYESLAFLKDVRRLVDDWLALGKAREDYLNIPPPRGSKRPKSMASEINRFHKRLIHQLIEVEYPDLVTISRPTFIQIVKHDEQREKAVRDQKLRSMQERIWKQTGFRWIAEALAGGNLTNLDPFYFTNLISSPDEPESILKKFSDGVKQRLRDNRPVLVGHNLFTDLIYFCRCFFGPLPDRVEDFQAMAHKMFPVLMDTKYMATHDCGSINPKSSLQEINDSLAEIPTPTIRVHPKYTKYNMQAIDHEAGYDSLLTAQVFIKLSAQLRDRGTSGIPPGIPATAEPGEESKKSTKQVIGDFEATVFLPRRPKSSAVRIMSGSIEIDRVDDADASNVADEIKISLGPRNSVEIQQKVDNGSLIPRLDAPFWNVYGNKLRVFGTKERMCHIG